MVYLEHAWEGCFEKAFYALIVGLCFRTLIEHYVLCKTQCQSWVRSWVNGTIELASKPLRLEKVIYALKEKPTVASGAASISLLESD